MKLIREFDDFEWAKSNIINPWILGYTGIHFDVEPTRENLNELIEMELSKDIANVDDWSKDVREDDIDIILNYFRSAGVSYLGIGRYGKLGYGNRKDYRGWEDINWIEYSKLIDNNLNESFDDFEWAREIPSTFNEYNQPSVGDVLICLPGYHAKPEYGVSEKNDPNCVGRGYAEGRIIVVDNIDVWDDGPEGKRVIVWPDEKKSRMYWDYDDEVCFGCGVYGFALTYYTDTLDESDEDNGLDWIINTDPNTPINFDSVVKNKRYRVEPTKVLLRALDACGDSLNIYDEAKSAKVEEIIYNSSYYNVFCGSDRDHKVTSLFLKFYDEDDYFIGGFWVADDMVKLYESYNTINENIEGEDNDLDWVINTDPNVPIPFSSVETGEKYRVEKTEVLLQALEACYGNQKIYYNAESVKLGGINYNIKYGDIFCDSDRDDKVIGLLLFFFDKDGNYLGNSWVTNDMVTLYGYYDKLTENIEGEDDWTWAKEIEPEIKLEPNTLYYFEPKLTVDEVETFADNIANAPQFAQWLRDLPNANGSVRSDGGIKYLITKPELPIRILGWCTETSIGYARSIYPGINVVDVRNTFSF